MTEREKFIELVDKAKEEYANDITDHTETDYIVETLFNNGAILPPCKVGDKVYRIAKDGKTIVEERIGEMHLEFTIEDGTGWHNTWWLKDYNIGVTTFLTKEEAEAKLKEFKENGI